jgi:hypothetical protein
MKYDKIRLVGANTVDLPIQGADPSGPFILKAVDGLGPTERDSNIAQAANETGVRQGAIAHNRQVVARIGLQAAWDIGQTAEELRSTLYGLLAPKYGQPVVLQLMSGATVKAQCQGDISKFEVAIFAKDPEVQITLDCDSPYLVAPEIVYELPVLSPYSGRTLMTINNPGDAPSGFWMSVKFGEALAAPFILQENDVLGRQLAINKAAWAVDDILTLDTRIGTRMVSKFKASNGVTSNQMGNISPTTTWLQLYGGINQLIFPVDTFTFNGNGFGYLPRWWGV